MLKSKVVVVVAAGLLLGGVTVASAQSVFPSSANETGPSNSASNAQLAEMGYNAGATAVFPSNFPSSANETGPSFWPASDGEGAGRAVSVGATGASTSSRAPWRIPRTATPTFPSSANEAGG